jgi:hypothetical protein
MGELRLELFALLAGVFAQARSRLAAFAYVGALLAEPGDRRSCWQLAEQAGQGYVLAVPVNFPVRLASGRKAGASAVAAMVPAAAWETPLVRAGLQGPPGRLVTMETPPPGPRPLAPLPRAAQGSRPSPVTRRRARRTPYGRRYLQAARQRRQLESTCLVRKLTILSNQESSFSP